MLRRPPRSPLFPTRRSSDLAVFSRRFPTTEPLSAGPLRRSGRSPWLHLSTSSGDRKSTRLNSSHTVISYAVFCLKKKKKQGRALAQISNSGRNTSQHVSAAE